MGTFDDDGESGAVSGPAGLLGIVTIKKLHAIAARGWHREEQVWPSTTSRLNARVPVKGRPVIGVGDGVALGSAVLDAGVGAGVVDDEKLSG